MLVVLRWREVDRVVTARLVKYVVQQLVESCDVDLADVAEVLQHKGLKLKHEQEITRITFVLNCGHRASDEESRVDSREQCLGVWILGMELGFLGFYKCVLSIV